VEKIMEFFGDLDELEERIQLQLKVATLGK